MNFNITEQPDYSLNTSLIDEMINLYGVLTKFLITEKINKDDVVFGDYSHMKTDSDRIYEMYMLPEITEDWDQSDMSFGQFGITNFENIQLFVSINSFEDIELDAPEGITGNLIVLPNNKIMEVTKASFEVPGVNNLFTYKDTKSVIKLSCKPYDVKLIQELDQVDISAEANVDYETLDTYFAELIGDATAQDTEAKVTAQVTTIQGDTKVEKPIVDTTESQVWGDF